MLIKRYKIKFSFPLLDSISCVSYDSNENLFLLTCFLENKFVHQIEFYSPLAKTDNETYEKHCGDYTTFNINNISNVEFVNKSDDKKRLLYAIANKDGEINLCFLKRIVTGNKILIESVHIIRPSSNVGFTGYIGSFFTKAPTISIKSLK